MNQTKESVAMIFALTQMFNEKHGRDPTVDELKLYAKGKLVELKAIHEECKQREFSKQYPYKETIDCIKKR